MIELHQFPKNRRTINFSPFCLKLETYLKMAKLPYKSVNCINPQKAPLKKLPFIVENGKQLPDSGLIVQHLEAKVGLDVGLTADQRSRRHLITRLFEGSLLNVLLYSRWMDEGGWSVTRKNFFKGLPAPLMLFVPQIAMKKTRGRLKSHGIALHTSEQIYEMGAADLEALSYLLGEKPYFLGPKVSTVDATAFGFLRNICFDVYDSPLKASARKFPNLVAFVERMTTDYYPDSPTAV